MSIIERVAELLGPITWPNPKSSTPGEEVGIPALDAIERAVSENNGRSRFPEARPARPGSRTSRTVKVDLDRLRKHSIITPDGERTPIAESFRRIKRQILAKANNPKASTPANLVLVTSALPGEGKTFCAINLAISIALEMDRNVLLVDADVAKPTILEVLGLNAQIGLMDLLRDRRIELTDAMCKTDIGKLTLLPSGSAHKHATELLASSTMDELLGELAERYRDRIILFDSPPLLAASEAAALAGKMGQIVMVVEAGKTTQAAVKAALGHVDSSKVAGLVLNKGQGHGLGYGDYGYGYGAG
jgi:exopolysaccharide/PEP-CTERM locus tyrosine autokinase